LRLTIFVGVNVSSCEQLKKVIASKMLIKYFTLSSLFESA